MSRNVDLAAGGVREARRVSEGQDIIFLANASGFPVRPIAVNRAHRTDHARPASFRYNDGA